MDDNKYGQNVPPPPYPGHVDSNRPEAVVPMQLMPEGIGHPGSGGPGQQAPVYIGQNSSQIFSSTGQLIIPGQTTIIMAEGNCPNCKVGHLIESFSCPGVMWLLCCGLIGLFCLLSQKDKKCPNCGFQQDAECCRFD